MVWIPQLVTQISWSLSIQKKTQRFASWGIGHSEWRGPEKSTKMKGSTYDLLMVKGTATCRLEGYSSLTASTQLAHSSLMQFNPHRFVIGPAQQIACCRRHKSPKLVSVGWSHKMPTRSRKRNQKWINHTNIGSNSLYTPEFAVIDSLHVLEAEPYNG